MRKIAYFDCFSGCSGDMLLGAILDAGLEMEKLKDGLSCLGIGGYRISSEKVMRGPIAATGFTVNAKKGNITPPRTLADILSIIEASGLPESVKEKSIAVFRRLGEAEAKIHGIPLEDVHFHELGALDTIIDVVGTLFALETMGIERCYCSALPAGRGTVKCDHGILPLPAPAALQLLAEARAPLTATPVVLTQAVELITPTGAALLTCLADFHQPAMTINAVGYGAGAKDFQNWPNVLRVWLGQEAAAAADPEMVLLETNIDDMDPRIYGYLMENLFGQGAVDVWFTPIQMKKDRPAVMLSVISPAAVEAALTDIIMRETSTLGLRTCPVSRRTAQRQIVEFASTLGQVKVKLKRFSGKIAGITAEYDDCRAIALNRKMPLRDVIRIVEGEARDHLRG